MRRTRPLVVLVATFAARIAYGDTGGLTSITSVTDTDGAATTTANFTGLSDDNYMAMPILINLSSISGAATVTAQGGWTRRPDGFDLILYTGAKGFSKSLTGDFDVFVTQVLFADAAGTATAAFTFTGSGQLLNFSTSVVGKPPDPTVPAGWNPTANNLDGTGNEAAYVTSGGFVFGTTTIASVKLFVTATQTALGAKDGSTSNFQFDALTTTPEPSTLALYGLGSAFAGAWVAARRRRAARRTTA
jgi:hypothetical protein